MENLRANHFESRDSGLNKNEFNLSAKSGRSVGKGKLCAAKIIRVVTVPPVFAALLTTILYIAMGDAAFANRFHYAEAVFSLSLLPVVPYALCAVIPALKKRGRKFERTVALIFSVTGYFMGATFAFSAEECRLKRLCLQHISVPDCCWRYFPSYSNIAQAVMPAVLRGLSQC